MKRLLIFLIFILFNVNFLSSAYMLENAPHDIKMLIAEKLDIKGHVKLRKICKELNRFSKVNFDQEYQAFKIITKYRLLTREQINSDLNSPMQIVTLLNALNRFTDHKDKIAHNAKIIAYHVSKFRLSPIFMVFGGLSELKKFKTNYLIQDSDARIPTVIFYSFLTEKFFLVTLLVISSAIAFLCIFPNVLSNIERSKEKFKDIPLYNSKTLSKHYSIDELDIINKCTYDIQETIGCDTKESCPKKYKHLDQFLDGQDWFTKLLTYEKHDADNNLIYAALSSSKISKRCLYKLSGGDSFQIAQIIGYLLIIIVSISKFCTKRKKVNLNIQEI